MVFFTVCIGGMHGDALLGAAESTELRVPILLNKPASLSTRVWPVTVGVPFKKGEFKGVEDLTVVDQAGKAVPCQIVKTGDWTDGSLRWVLVDFTADLSSKYFLARGARIEAPDDIRIQETTEGITVQTGPAQYVFPKGAGCFDSVRFDLNRDGKFEEGETLVSGARGAFYVLDSQGRRGVLQGTKMTVESNGKRHAVVRVEGEYFVAQSVSGSAAPSPQSSPPTTGERKAQGESNAAGVVYFHFYAGQGMARVSHKLILTQNTNQLWFRDIGMQIPVRLTGEATASVNFDHEKPQSTFTQKLAPGKELVMLQDDYPHFGSMASHCGIYEDVKGAKKEPQPGIACGDWADVSSSRGGVAAQVPAFAEQFPKAFRLSTNGLTIKLWAEEGGKELDYRTAQIMKNYFGHDWIPEDAPCMKVANMAQGTAKIHDIWIYPHAGALTPEIISGFGATREEIYATIDPSWTARSEVMGPIHPKDTQRFAEVEEVISDYFDRSVLAGDKVFPRTGYLYWGMYPYSAQGWELKNGRWYPTIHRLARSLEYNLKRSTWILYARSGERKYFDYSRKYTRLCGNLLFSNSDSPTKPIGWMIQGDFHNPIIWGSGDGTAPKDFKAAFQGDGVCLSYASSEDVIQFVYDYFLTGDLHSRDMVRFWKEAMIQEMNFDVDKALKFFPPSAFFRVLGSAYELDHDPRLLDYGNRIMKKHIALDGTNILNPEIATNYGKEGEVFSGFYYYYVATGDPLVKKALVELAKFRYRQARLDGFFSRASCQLQCFALAFQETGDPAYAAHLAQVLKDEGRNYVSLKKMGVDFAALNQKTSTPWGQQTMDGQAAITIGMPVAECVITSYTGPKPYLPVAIKPHPTQRTWIFLKKEKTDVALLDVYVNNWGERSIEPKLIDAQGKAVKIEVLERNGRRLDPKESFDANSIWYNFYAEPCFFKLSLPKTVPPGIYQFDLGSEIAFTILNSSIDKVLQVAPNGIVLSEGRIYYFQAPEGATAIEYFASRPVRIRDPSGNEVMSEDLKDGRYRLPTGGKGGAWRIEGGNDTFCPDGKIASFVRIDKVLLKDKSESFYPLVIALGDPTRLFPVETAVFKPAIAEASTISEVKPEEPYVESKSGFGEAIRLADQIVEVLIPPATGQEPPKALPHQRGTVEFWFRPLWSATDCYLTKLGVGSTQRLQFYHGDPVALSYWIDPDNGGRTGRYNLVFLALEVNGVQKSFGSTRTRAYFEAGKWYHIALTWNVDGKNNECNIFLNGRKMPFFHYDRLMKPDEPVSNLAVPGQTVRFGSAHTYGSIATSERYDELRISSSVRYTQDFEPPTGPFAADKEAVVLMHFDGNLDGSLNGAPVKGVFKKGGKMW